MLANIVACCVINNDAQLFVKLHGDKYGNTIDDIIDYITKEKSKRKTLRLYIIRELTDHQLNEHSYAIIRKLWDNTLHDGILCVTLEKVCRLPYSDLKFDFLKLMICDNAIQSTIVKLIFVQKH